MLKTLNNKLSYCQNNPNLTIGCSTLFFCFPAAESPLVFCIDKKKGKMEIKTKKYIIFFKEFCCIQSTHIYFQNVITKIFATRIWLSSLFIPEYIYRHI